MAIQVAGAKVARGIPVCTSMYQYVRRCQFHFDGNATVLNGTCQSLLINYVQNHLICQSLVKINNRDVGVIVHRSDCCQALKVDLDFQLPISLALFVLFAAGALAVIIIILGLMIVIDTVLYRSW